MYAVSASGRGGKPVDLTTAKIDMRIGIAVVSDTNDYAVPAKICARGGGQGVGPVRCAVIIIQGPWCHRLRRKVAHEGKIAYLLQDGGRGNFDKDGVCRPDAGLDDDGSGGGDLPGNFQGIHGAKPTDSDKRIGLAEPVVGVLGEAGGEF